MCSKLGLLCGGKTDGTFNRWNPVGSDWSNRITALGKDYSGSLGTLLDTVS
jgi:hypothetical protein